MSGTIRTLPTTNGKAHPADDVITGYGGHINRIYGGSGNDVLSAGKHAPLDLLSGGNLLVGDDGNDTLKGGLGDDQLYGGTGADVMMGGPGDDTYGVDDPGDVIVERASWAPVQGGDVVYSTVDFSLAGIPVERLLLEGSAIRGTGKNQRNTIFGNQLAITSSTAARVLIPSTAETAMTFICFVPRAIKLSRTSPQKTSSRRAAMIPSGLSAAFMPAAGSRTSCCRT